GAFGSDLWLSHWTILDQAGFLPKPETIVNVTDASITGNTVWYSTNVYLLEGLVFVEDGETLTIEPGTIVRGKPGQGASASALIVARGGKIFAEGTPNNPILFTAQDDDVEDPFDFGPTDRGLWGGLIILGRATLNSPVASGTPITDNIEGIPVEEVRGIYGGNDDNDNSGVIRYVSIRHGGSNIGANNEINGLTLGAVGRGTVVEFVEVIANLDDGVEFFGGTVNTKYLVVGFCGDDSFDYDQGFRGKGQFWFTIQDTDADAAGEHDGDIDDFTKLPLANPTIYNATYIGAGAASGVNQRALRIRENAAGKYINSIFTDFGGNGIQIDTTSTNQLALGNLDLRNNLWWGFGAGNTAAQIANADAQVLFTDASRMNEIVDPQLRGISREPDGGLDPRPGSGSPAWSGAAMVPDDGFFTAAAYRGAFAGVNWASDWTYLSHVKILNPRGGGNPMDMPAMVGPAAPILSIQQVGSDVEIRFASETGVTYQLQSAA
ncbi:MAG TPA: T9SS C-terminal target domain-containing protein, partial [Verrucomicrobiae bacterium]|nr:T9SS C-terminal target domain-containing protein [Verrucomicrobiae bacterium]